MWRRDRSWVENCLTSWVPVTLAAMAVTSLALHYVREPISCQYVFPQANEYFTETCFQQTSILMRSDKFLQYSAQVWARERSSAGGGRGSSSSSSGEEEEDPFLTWPKQRTYHHWVPFALGLASLLSLLPLLIVTHALNALLWLDGHALLQTLDLSNDQSPSGTEQPQRVTTTMIDSASVLAGGLKREGRWKLSLAALGRKTVAGVTSAVLLLLVLWFKPPLGALVAEEQEGSSSGNVTVPVSLEDVPLPVDPFFCNVDYSQRRNVQHMTIQCRLPLNQVFVKAFILLFYLFLVLLVLCLGDLFYWMARLFLPHVRDATLRRHLSILTHQSQGGGATDYDSARFSDFLGTDGRMVLALVTDHCGPVAGLRFTAQLWHAYQKEACLSPRSSAFTIPNPAHNVTTGVKMDDGGAYVIGSPGDVPLQAVHHDMSLSETDTAKLYSA